jgi:predicted Holliday junction resolvase-like endonuclease
MSSDATALIGLLVVLLVFAVAMIVWLMASANKVAESKFNQWKAHDIAMIQQAESRNANLAAVAQLEAWKQDYAMAIRQDAINRSQAVIMGKVTEHLVPFFPMFPFNPKDARFIGSPIDLLIFEGLDEGDLKEIIFLEIKVNTSRTTARQRQIRDAITENRVVWREMSVPRPQDGG